MAILQCRLQDFIIREDVQVMMPQSVCSFVFAFSASDTSSELPGLMGRTQNLQALLMTARQQSAPVLGLQVMYCKFPEI